LIRFKIEPDELVRRVLGGEFGELPEGEEMVPWFSCMLVKTLLEDRHMAVTKEEFTGMAAVIMGFMTEDSLLRRLHSSDDELVVSHRRTKKETK